jgi:hypothetical protein
MGQTNSYSASGQKTIAIPLFQSLQARSAADCLTHSHTAQAPAMHAVRGSVRLHLLSVPGSNVFHALIVSLGFSMRKYNFEGVL